MALADYQTGVVLSGGGARAAYQVGARRAVAHILGRADHAPFRVICGTSAGAINAAMLAVHAESFRRGVARLLKLWRRIDVGDVYRADLATVSTHGMLWLAAVLIGSRGPRRAASMLDNAPLSTLLDRQLDLGGIETQVKSGVLHALSINATSYTTGQAVSFYQGSRSIAPWQRTRRRGVPATIGSGHLLASTAIPFVFPAVRVDDDYYADGSVRQIAPLSSALHLGARRILVVAVGQFTGQHPPPATRVAPRYPSFAQVAGHALSSIFLDNLGADLERLEQLNRLLRLVRGETLQRHQREAAHVDALVLAPSRDLGEMAIAHRDRLPRGVRYLLRGFGSTQGTGANLLSYLLFDRRYCRALLSLGYRDTLNRHEEIEAFLAGESVRFLPVFPPELR